MYSYLVIINSTNKYRKHKSNELCLFECYLLMTRFKADDAGEVEVGGRGRLGGGKGADDGDVDKTCRFAV